MDSLQKIIDEDATIVANSNLIDWDRLDGKTVLISGANGYVPSYFVFALLKHNEIYGTKIKVVALCRSLERAEKKFASLLNDSCLELLIQDVTQSIEYENSVDYIIHAASPAGYFSRHFSPAQTYNANIIGCRNLLELSLGKSVSGFLLLSSVDVYGRNSSVTRLSESDYGYLDPINPRNAYSSSKMASEGLALSYMSEHDIPVRVVRPFQILGNGLDLEDGRLHVDFVSQLLKNNSIVLKGDGKPERTFMYVTDAITAMLRVMLVGKCGEAYNICDERGEISVLKLAEMMIQLKSGSDGDVLFDVSKRNLIEVVEAIPCVLGDSTKLRQLGFHSQYDLSNGLRRMMSAYGVEVS